MYVCGWTGEGTKQTPTGGAKKERGYVHDD